MNKFSIRLRNFFGASELSALCWAYFPRENVLPGRPDVLGDLTATFQADLSVQDDLPATLQADLSVQNTLPTTLPFRPTF